MRYGSVCSGIEAATVAWAPLGWRAAWFSEIDKWPSALLAHRYPSVPNLHDMTVLPDMIRAGLVEAPDVLCGGTPCQAFSVAGKRQSLDDARGNLSLTFCEIANAIDEQRTEPAIIFWENVPGVLNTKDNAFGCFLAELAGESVPLEPSGGKWTNAGVVLGPKRAVAWRVLDAQYFGVTQRRRRVFVVASARDDIDPAAVLFEPEGVRRDTPPSREARQEVTEVAGTLAANGGGLNRPAGNANKLDFCVASFTPSSFANYSEGVGTLKAHGGDLGGGSETLIAEKVPAYGIPGNWINRKPENGGNAVEPMHDLAPCLTKTDQHGVSRGLAVRRLTPTECERLQGFPDGYTLLDDTTPDGPRYKALGNSWAVPVVRWIGERIDAHLKGQL